MATDTKIQWAHHTGSPWYGCNHAELPNGTPHPGCLDCYAERMAMRNPGALGKWGPDGTRVRSKSFWDNCRKWNAAAAKAGERRRQFPSQCDPFEDWQGLINDSKGQVLHRGKPWGVEGYVANDLRIGKSIARMDDLRADLFATIDACPWLDFLLLTKRPQNIRRMWQEGNGYNGGGSRNTFSYRDNVWLIYSASDQTSLEAGAGELHLCRDLCPVLGLSLEPLLGPIDLRHWIMPMVADADRAIRFVIVGGESDQLKPARPCDIRWVRNIVRQCQAAGLACFVKQLGSNVVTPNDEVSDWFDSCPELQQDPTERFQGAVGRIRGLRDKGGDIDQFPEDLRVREFPQVEVSR